MTVMDSSDRDVAKFIRGLAESTRDRVIGVRDLESDADGIQDTSYGKAVVEFARQKIDQGASAPEVVEEYLALGQSLNSIFVVPNDFVDAVEDRFLKENEGRPFGPDQKEMLGVVLTQMVQDKALAPDLSDLTTSSVIESAVTRVGSMDALQEAKANARKADLAAQIPRTIAKEIAQPEISTQIEEDRQDDHGRDGGR